jgi:2-polyprenyl-6-methoxyphenol hydroxylase-like FAD-dependent oxidoreductase
MMRVLISGAGIAGPTLAYWLAHYGLRPTIVEVAPRLRTGGYVIDFWGAGFDIAGRMGLLSELNRKGYHVREVRAVDEKGKRVAGFATESIEEATQGKFVSLARSDLSATIFTALEGKAEAIFGDSIERLEQKDKSVRVEFRRGGEREFDLVIGADGLHSPTREIVFGAESQYEKYLGYKVAAFQVEGYGVRDELAYVMYTQVGQQVARFSLRDDRTMFMFIFRDEEYGFPGDMEGQRSVLRRRFGDAGWECTEILNALDRCGDLYFDRISQIRMDENGGLWSKGRVALLGDAAFCVSLLAGQGSALAMVAAYILAGELHRAQGDFGAAFENYQKLFGPFVRRKQRAALGMAGFFAPRSSARMWMRNQVMNLMSFPWIANMALGRGLIDKIVLPDY